jgi:type IV pilus assembly protein PilV
MKPLRTGSRQHGMSLLEAMLGILLFSVGILAVVGIQAMAVRNVAESKYRMDASFLANQLIGEMWANRTNMASYNFVGGTPPSILNTWIARVGAELPGTTANPPTVNITGTTVTITIYWQAPEEAHLNPPPLAHQHVVNASIDCC